MSPAKKPKRKCRIAPAASAPPTRRFSLAAETDLRKILDGLKALKPDVVIVDSIQTMWADGVDAAPGTVAQVRACAHELVRYAKKSGARSFSSGTSPRTARSPARAWSNTSSTP